MPPTPRPLRRVERHPDAPFDPAAWPDPVPAVTQLLTAGLDVPAGVTFLVGEDGAGRSTLVEGTAAASGVHVEGGTRHHHAGTTRGTRSDGSDLGRRLHLVRPPGAGRDAFLLRAETVHRSYDHLEGDRDEQHRPRGAGYHARSHGEGFADLLTSHWVRDADVVLAGSPHRLAASGRQVLCATRSPLPTALSGATVLQVDGAGLTPVDREDLALVRDRRFFLDAPERCWRHVL